MLRIRPTAAPRTGVNIRTKRPPMAYIQMLSASEEDFRSTVHEIEADPLFRELHSMGVVRRRGGRGRMPSEAYEQRLDDEVRAFLEKYDLADEPDALEKIQEALEKRGAQAVAKRLRAPISEVRRLERFLSEPSRADESGGGSSSAEPAPYLDDFVSAAPSIDITEATATVRDFVERFSVGRDCPYGTGRPGVG